MGLRLLEAQEFDQSPFVRNQEPHGTPVHGRRILGQRLEFSDVGGPIHQRLLDELFPRECPNSVTRRCTIPSISPVPQVMPSRIAIGSNTRAVRDSTSAMADSFSRCSSKFFLLGEKPVHA